MDIKDQDKETEIKSDEAKNKLSNEFDGVIPDEILEAIPVGERGKVISIIKQSMFSSVMRRGNPISEKITEEHITKLIDKSDSQDIRDREERKNLRNYNLILLIIGLVFLGFLIVFLKNDKELLYKVIIAIISFVGGFGLGKTSTKKED